MLAALRDMTWSSASQSGVLESLRQELARLQHAVTTTLDIQNIRVVPQLRRMRQMSLLQLRPLQEATAQAPAMAAGLAPLRVAGGAGATAVRPRPGPPDRALCTTTATTSFENATVLGEDFDRAVDDTTLSSSGLLVAFVRRTLRSIQEAGRDLATAYATTEAACAEMVQLALSAYEAGSPECDEAVVAAQAYVYPGAGHASHTHTA